MRRRHLFPTVSCYMCSGAATSREHVPPRCLFPELRDLPVGFDFRKNLISVPSCDLHNSEKAKDDEYLMFLLSTALQGNRFKQQHFETKVMRALRRKPAAYGAFMPNLTPVAIQEGNGPMVETCAFEVDVDRFSRCTRHIACGVLYHHTSLKPLNEVRVVTDAFAALKGPNAEETNRLFHDMTLRIGEAFSLVPIQGENRPIFQYRLHTTAEGVHAVLMIFYEGIRVAAIINDA